MNSGKLRGVPLLMLLSLHISTNPTIAAKLVPFSHAKNHQARSTWQEVAPNNEEFSILVPQMPNVSSGSKLFSFGSGKEVTANFRVYSLFSGNTLFVIQSYEVSKPSDLVKDVFWSRRKSLSFERTIELNGYKGKLFTQRVDGIFHRGKYFLTRSHLYIVEAARRGNYDPSVDEYLNSFKLQNLNQVPLRQPSATDNKAEPTPLQSNVFSTQEVTQKAVILSKQFPSFTQEARGGGITGNVKLQATLLSSGKVGDIEVLSGLPYGITEQAIENTKLLIFIPAEKDGKLVSQRITVEYSFSIY